MNTNQHYYITGVSGTGKTTISRALNEMGITSYDIGAVPGLCSWRNKNTKAEVTYSSGMDQKWFDDHERVCDKGKLEELLGKHKGVVVITGTASGNQDEYLDLFDKVFLLRCRPEVFVDRLKTRDTNIFAKTPEEQQHVVEWQKSFDPHMIAKGAIPVSSEGSISDLVMKLVAQF